jgi:hypothetical protein
MTATRAVTAATATTTAMITPNGDEDNKDGNSKNNDKATMTLTATTEGVSVVNHTETIAAEDIVVSAMPPLRSWLPCRDTFSSVMSFHQ